MNIGGLNIGLNAGRSLISMLWPTGTEPGGWWSTRGLTLGSSQSPVVSYQESTGVTQAVAVNDPVGLMLDRRLGLALGPELVTGNNLSGFSATGLATVNSISRFTLSGNNISNRVGLNLGSSTAGVYQWTVTLKADKIAAVVASNLWSSTKSLALTTGYQSFTFYLADDNNAHVQNVGFYTVADSPVVVDVQSISVKQLLGNHLSQATAASRPLESARVNLLTKTENFADAAWNKVTATVSAGTEAASAVITATGAVSSIYQVATVASGVTCVNAVDIRRVSGVGAIALFTPNNVTNPVTITGAWTRFSISGPAATTSCYFRIDIATSGDAIEIRYPQAEVGSTPTRYQRVDTATDYDTSGFPVYYKFDGVDDGVATATFAGGTLSNSMAAFILMRRDSAAASVVVRDAAASTLFGFYGSGSSTPSLQGVGASASYLVNGIAVPGGNVATAGQLDTAMPSAGNWLLMEARTLNLSAWTQLQVSQYAGLFVNGGIAEIILCEESKAALYAPQIRRYMGALAGLAL